jgi:hypothetical protein
MRNEHIKDYLWSEMVDPTTINNKRLMNNCLIIEKFLEGRIDRTKLNNNWTGAYGSFTGKNFNQYNIFTFPSADLIKLYTELRRVITPVFALNESYMIQAWLNVYRENGYIDWHNHWAKASRALHGFYCVNVEDTPSYTEYKFPTLNDDITTIHSKDGLLVFGKSEDDFHRSSPGWNSSNPRITIAFDIIPVATLQESYKNNFFEGYRHNHYFPI